ncbi:carotenoid oxygenase family protein [Chamaesiphon minutus]|uniref:Lignostilbene-alpha,beta-dioxygenase-like enzyme n=1 Tax=Chamaesiphon minutus (strain ATCC 27169 / PCC 6605) TaxID=1173020 RepID=K9UHC2_CHAP6|nr:carotenoid oxygenase family protein [Chamaesiphon minutus]AFY94507.1 lignostilbene-alpha,beta-dioxygenase-like enzyme [Chamaesiphon minutus PCC 6605]
MQTKSTELPYDITQWRQGYRSQPQEYDYQITEIDGQIPPELTGTLFRNGPGLFDINEDAVRHPFDGDGMICRITFKDGKAHFLNRFVQTEAYVAEKAAGKFLYRGVFGTQKAGGWLSNAFDVNLKNIANTQVVYWGGKLLALWEAAEPHRLDPKTLNTLGIEYLNNTLKPGDPFAAHPLFDPKQNRMVNFGLKAGKFDTTGLLTGITIYELDLDGKVVKEHSHTIPGFAFIHDFAITPNYCIFFQNPVGFNPFPFLFGLKGAGECVKFQPEKPTKIIIIPRNSHSGEKVQMLETKSGFVFHHANAFEHDGKISIDSIAYATFPEIEEGKDFRDTNFSSLSPGQLWRFEMDLQTRQVESTLVEPRCCEFPTINPANVGYPYRYVYMGAAQTCNGNAPLQSILKLDRETGEQQLWTAAPTGYVNEPVFVPRPGGTQEDDGWLIAMIYDGAKDRSAVVVLDAADLTKGAVATLHLTHHIPYGLHGSWTDEIFIDSL